MFVSPLLSENNVQRIKQEKVHKLISFTRKIYAVLDICVLVMLTRPTTSAQGNGSMVNDVREIN